MKPDYASVHNPNQVRVSKSCKENNKRVADRRSIPFTFRLAADLALAAWKETSPVIGSWQL